MSKPVSDEDRAMMDEWLKHNKVTKVKSKPMAPELGISNITWGQKATKVKKPKKPKKPKTKGKDDSNEKF
jgi:hypothetical protein